MADEEQKKTPEQKPKPNPADKSAKGLPINPRDMTPGRSGTYQTR